MDGQDTRYTPERRRFCQRMCGWEVYLSEEIVGSLLLACQSGTTHWFGSVPLIPVSVSQTASHWLGGTCRLAERVRAWLDAGHSWILSIADAGYWVLGAGCWVLGAGRGGERRSGGEAVQTRSEWGPHRNKK